MPRFPFPLGGASFEEKDRYERATAAVNRLTGEGGFSDDESSLFRRTMAVFAEVAAGVSLYTSRLLEQVFPNSAHAEDCLARHESHLRVIVPHGATVEGRWEILEDIRSDRGGARVIDIKQRLERVVGAGNVIPRWNTAAFLDANGSSRRFMFAVAFEVPVAVITTIGQINKLDNIIKIYKPVHVGAWVTRVVARGFLTDDPLSLTDRDVLDL